jgi:hypothetical protein
MVMGQNEGRIQSERKLPGAPDEGEIILKRQGEGDFRMQQQRRKRRKRKETMGKTIWREAKAKKTKDTKQIGDD